FFFFWIIRLWLFNGTGVCPAQFFPSFFFLTARTPGILVFVYVNVLLFVMRSFAGKLVHGRSPIAVLWFSALLSALGLSALSHATSAVTAYAAATVWGVGVCFFWPTMLGVAAEQFP